MSTLLLSSLLWMAVAADNADAASPAVVEVKDAQPSQSIFDAASRKEPLELKSRQEAEKHFSEDALAKLAKQVDFEKQVVLVFAWKGSGQDRLDVEVLESFPEQVVFRYKRGLTRDLRPHVHVYALRSNVKWSVK
ncbi:MAG: hypothetical protein RIC55_21935 [Pirellulaceae bacterium]